jgi:hypothetical protein
MRVLPVGRGPPGRSEWRRTVGWYPPLEYLRHARALVESGISNSEGDDA